MLSGATDAGAWQKAIHASLLAERETIRMRLRALDGEIQGAGVEDDGVPASDYGRDITISAVLHRRLEEIEAALGRLDDGTYGWCIRCGGEIPRRRLEAMPGATRCVSCQESEDRLGRRAAAARLR
jgi:phage/conjugal plasmid C-4 type zinc finger TraR family protein